MNKTKEMTMDFRRTRNKPNMSIIKKEVEVVEEYKYLEMQHWCCPQEGIRAVCASWGSLSPSVYAARCCISSASLLWRVQFQFFSSDLFRYEHHRQWLKKLNKLIKKTDSVLEPLDLIVQRWMLDKMKKYWITLNISFTIHWFSGTVFQSETSDWDSRSFLPTAITICIDGYCKMEFPFGDS